MVEQRSRPELRLKGTLIVGEADGETKLVAVARTMGNGTIEGDGELE